MIFIRSVPVSELGAVVGENYSDRGSLVHTVVLLLIHQDFDPYSLASDVALLRVYEDIAYRFQSVSITYFFANRIVSLVAELLRLMGSGFDPVSYRVKEYLCKSHMQTVRLWVRLPYWPEKHKSKN